MTDLETEQPRAVGATHDGVPAKGPRPVLAWAGIGAAFTAIAIFAHSSWIISGNATRVGPGPDPIPTGTALAMLAFQIVSPILAVGAIAYMVRKSIRERQLCVETAIVIGSGIQWWHDPLINWLQPALFYNAGMVNFGNWMGKLPGVLAPDAGVMAEPVLICRPCRGG